MHKGKSSTGNELSPLSLNGKQISFSIGELATVLSHDRSNETEVWSSGGGGYVGRYGGHIEAPTVHSRINENQDVWLRSDSRKEFSWSFKNHSIKVRPGHVIATVNALCKGYEEIPILWYNLSTDICTKLRDGDQIRGAFGIGPLRSGGFARLIKAVLIYFLAMFGIAILIRFFGGKQIDSLSAWAAVYFLPFLVIYLYWNSREKRRINKAERIEVHLEKVSNELRQMMRDKESTAPELKERLPSSSM